MCVRWTPFIRTRTSPSSRRWRRCSSIPRAASTAAPACRCAPRIRSSRWKSCPRIRPNSPPPTPRTTGSKAGYTPEARVSAFDGLTREQLLKALEMFAKNWLAHDGCWFLAAEERLGMEVAIELDVGSWARFAASEARRILATFGIPPNGGLAALEQALALRMYALINAQRIEWSADRRTLRFFMDVCRVQETRRRKGLPDFPCKSVGTVEFANFARTVDPRIRTRCLHCPPAAPSGKYCGWEFTID